MTNNKNNLVDFLCGILILAIVLITIISYGTLITAQATKINDKKWQQECIDRGFAQYNSVTGEWEWIE